MSLFNKLVVGSLPIIPKPIVRAVAARYVAGSRVDEAMATAKKLQAEGACATTDILGEEVTERERAGQFTAEYIDLFRQIKASGVDSNVSVKLTMLGLKIDEAFCRDNLQRLYEAARDNGNWLTIDMEDHTTTTATLGLYRAMLAEFHSGGTVLQAYMRRTLEDIARLPEHSNIRLCKGIYVEPESIAFKGYQEIRDNFMLALDALFDRGIYAGIATHDAWLIARSEELIAKRNVKKDMYEFQMLLGVEPALRKRVIERGHKMRVYVPYGSDWYAYSIRRLRENPAVAGHALKAMFGMGQKDEGAGGH